MGIEPRILPEAIAKVTTTARKAVKREAEQIGRVLEEASGQAVARVKDGVQSVSGKLLKRAKVPQVKDAAAADLARRVGKVGPGAKLSFPEVGATDADLAAALRNKSDLVEVDLSVSHISNSGVALLARYRGLRKLDLSCMERLSNKGLQALAGLPELQVLGLSGTGSKFTNEGLAILKTFPQLRSLDIHFANFDGRGLAHIADLKGLQSLTLGEQLDKVLVDADLKYLTGLTNLRQLAFTLSHLSDAGLAHLKGLTRLEKLIFPGVSATDVGVAHLKNLANLRELELGTFGQGKITDKGMKVFSGMTKMQKLYLGHAEITNKGLAELRGLTELRELGLSDASITDDGLKYLEGMKHLRFLDVGDRVTEAAAKRLAKKIPGLKVVGNWPTWPGI